MMFITLLSLYGLFLFLSIEQITFLAEEDGPIEWFGAFSLLLSAIFFFMSFRRSKRGNDFLFIKPQKNIFLLLLGLLMLFGFLEEISWGQRIFQVPTPAFLEEANNQREINIHNLKTFMGFPLNSNFLLTLFWLSFCCLVPVLYYLVPPLKRFFDRINLPIVPLFISFFFVLNYIVSIITPSLNQTDIIPISDVVEAKESYISFLFFIISVWHYDFLQIHQEAVYSSSSSLQTSLSEKDNIKSKSSAS